MLNLKRTSRRRHRLLQSFMIFLHSFVVNGNFLETNFYQNGPILCLKVDEVAQFAIVLSFFCTFYRLQIRSQPLENTDVEILGGMNQML